MIGDWITEIVYLFYFKIKPFYQLKSENILCTYQCRIRSACLDWNTSRCLFLIAVNYWRVKQVVPNTAYFCFTFFFMLSALVARTRGLCKIESCYHCIFIIVINVFYDVYVDANTNCRKDSTFRYITFLILEPITKM